MCITHFAVILSSVEFAVKLTLWIIAYTAGIIRLSMAVILMLRAREPGDFWQIGFLLSFILCIISLSNMETVYQLGRQDTVFSIFALYAAIGITVTLPVYITRAVRAGKLAFATLIGFTAAGTISLLLLTGSLLLLDNGVPIAVFAVIIGTMAFAVLYAMVILATYKKPGPNERIIAVFVILAVPAMIYFDFFRHYAAEYYVLPVMYLVINIMMIASDIPLFTQQSTQNGCLDSVKMTEAGLTRRECQVAELLVKGRTYRSIADELCISLETVKTHVSKIYGKAGTANKMELLQVLSGAGNVRE